MPHQELAFRRQTAVLWPFTGYDGYGQAKVGTPVEISVRWSWTRRESLDSKGNSVVLDALVIVGQDVGIGSLLYLGNLASWYGTDGGSGSGASDSLLHEVITSRNTPDLKARATFRTLGVMRYRTKPP